MNEDKNNPPSARIPRRRMSIVIIIVLIMGAISASLAYRWRPTGELTGQNVADITAVIQQRTATPIGAITPKRGCTVQVYVRERGKLGGHIFDVKKSAGAWRITQETLLF
jgi:hypothetical protein